MVTGAGSGIGRALALASAARGMKLALCDVDEAGLAETTRLAGDGETLSQRVDVRDPARLAAFAEAAAKLGVLKLVFANAGVLRGGAVSSQSAVDIDLLIDVNFKGAVYTAQAFAPLLKRTPTPSRLIITGSQASFVAYPNLSIYAASKHAVLVLAEALRGEFAQTAPQVGVSLLCPGAVSTAMTASNAGGPQYITPDELARRAFAGVDAGRFLIFSHPEFEAAFRARFAALSEEAWP